MRRREGVGEGYKGRGTDGVGWREGGGREVGREGGRESGKEEVRDGIAN